MLPAHIDVIDLVRRRGKNYLRSREFAEGCRDGCFYVKFYPLGDVARDMFNVWAMHPDFASTIGQIRVFFLDSAWADSKGTEDVELSPEFEAALAAWKEDEVRSGVVTKVDLQPHIKGVEESYSELHWVPGDGVVALIEEYLQIQAERREDSERFERIRQQESAEARMYGHGP